MKETDKIVFVVTVKSQSPLTAKLIENYVVKAIKRFGTLDKTVSWFSNISANVAPKFTVRRVPFEDWENEPETLRALVKEMRFANSNLIELRDSIDVSEPKDSKDPW